MLATSIFSFSHYVFNLAKTKAIVLTTFTLSSAYAFNSDQAKFFSFGTELNLYQITTRFLRFLHINTLPSIGDF